MQSQRFVDDVSATAQRGAEVLKYFEKLFKSHESILISAPGVLR